MAVKGTEEQATQTAAPGMAEPQMAAPGVQDSGPRFGGTGHVSTIINRLNSNQPLTGAANEYIEALRKSFSVEGGGGLVKVDVKRLTQPYGAHAFISNGRAIVLLFSELLTQLDTQNFTPMSAHIIRVGQALKELGGDVKLLNAVIVQPGDYSRTTQMSQSISTTLAVATIPSLHNMSVAEISESQFAIDPDINSVRSYINQRNPSSVMPRADVGFVIYAKSPKKNNQPFIQGPEEMLPVAGVSAYTEIQKTIGQNGMIRYQPLVHITGIWSDIPVPGMIPYCIAVAADQLTGQNGRWIQQFTSFQKGRPNLGQLFNDPSDQKKLWFTNNMDEVGKLRREYFNDPILVIDVVEGQTRIPYLASYSYLNGAGAVYAQIQTFFGDKVPLDRTQIPFLLPATDYIGVYGDRSGGTLLDSRNLDYMTLLVDGSQDAMTQLMLLEYPADPAGRSRILFDKTAGSYKSLYTNTLCVPSAYLLGTLARAVQGTLSIEPPQGQNRMVSTDWVQAHVEHVRQQNLSVSRYNTIPGYTGSGNLYQV